MLVDHPPASHDAAVRFWAAALGSDATPEDDAGRYHDLGPLGAVQLAIQRLDDPAAAPRVHVDIETDDVVAETARLVGLGAQVVQERAGYRILADPGGLAFCVVPIQHPETFAENATTWSAEPFSPGAATPGPAPGR
jgi:hypothetical protein